MIRLRSYCKLFLTAFILLTAAIPAYPRWESIRTERSDVKTIIRDTDIEIKAGRGVLQITTNRPIQVKIYTILGRAISTETIPAGTSQYLLRSHGVYIVKIADITAKIAV